MSRMALALLLLIATAPSAHAQDAPLSAEEALAESHAMTGGANGADCPRDPFDPDQIMVCGKDDSARQRLPLPTERAPREGARRATGELPAASAVPVRTASCGVIQNGQSCGGGLNALAAVPLLVKGVIKLIDPEAEVEPPPTLPKP